jgi:hypothetical protein
MNSTIAQTMLHLNKELANYGGVAADCKTIKNVLHLREEYTKTKG